MVVLIAILVAKILAHALVATEMIITADSDF